GGWGGRGRRWQRRWGASRSGAAASGRPTGGGRNSQPGLHAPAGSRLQRGVREIVLDTETTGLDPLAGHRIVEVGCIELVNTVATGKHFQAYFNPEMIMPTGAEDIHGLTDDFLANKPLFADRIEDMLAFIGEARLIIHNA